LVFHDDLSSQFLDRVRGKAKTGLVIDVGRVRIPLLAPDGFGVKNRPDQATAVMPIADSAKCRIQEGVGFKLQSLAVAIAMREIGVDRAVVARAELLAGFVVDA
jgi:hypothetical protein